MSLWKRSRKEQPALRPSKYQFGELVESGNVQALEPLLQKWPDLASTMIGYSEDKKPLIEAARKGHKPMVELLLEFGADIEGRSIGSLGYQRTALHWAAIEGRRDVAASLLARKASIDARDADGKTALMLAAEKGDVGVVELLLSNGADTSLKSNSGRTTEDLAAYSLRELLRSHAEKKNEQRRLADELKDANPSMFSRATILTTGTGSGDAEADERLVGRVIKAFNHLYSTNVQPVDFSVKFGVNNSFVLKVNLPIPATEQLGEEMTAALDELLTRNGLR